MATQPREAVGATHRFLLPLEVTPFNRELATRN
jgi:hypothetical protein